MKISKSNIVSTIIFVLMIGTVVGIAASYPKKKNEKKINFISLEGDYHLLEKDYLEYAGLLDKSNYPKLTLPIIRDRIIKHPYVQNVEVAYSESKVVITIKEKTFESILMKGEDQFILTDRLHVLPLLTGTQKVDIPIIAEPSMNSKIKEFTSLKMNHDVLTAAQILTAVKLVNSKLHDNISSLNMKDGGEIELYLSSADYPVLIGRGNEIKKIISFNSFWDVIAGKEYSNYLEYVDLRYSNHLYFRLFEPKTTAEEMKS
jgi:cell division septal protein FtsQ